MLVGLKLGEQVLNDPGVDLVVWGGSPYGRSVLDETHESRIDRRMRYDDKASGWLCDELGIFTAVYWFIDAVVVGPSRWGKSYITVETLLEIPVERG